MLQGKAKAFLGFKAMLGFCQLFPRASASSSFKVVLGACLGFLSGTRALLGLPSDIGTLHGFEAVLGPC